MKRAFGILVIIAVLVVPAVAAAHTSEDPINLPFWGAPLLACTAQDHPTLPGTAVTEVCNDFCDIVHTVQHLLYFAITVLLFAIVPLGFLVGGLMMIVSRGGEGVSEARKVMFGSLTSAAVVLLAFVIVNITLNSIGRREDGPRVFWGSTIDCEV